jgi:hypothetical protein
MLELGLRDPSRKCRGPEWSHSEEAQPKPSGSRGEGGPFSPTVVERTEVETFGTIDGLGVHPSQLCSITADCHMDCDLLYLIVMLDYGSKLSFASK